MEVYLTEHAELACWSSPNTDTARNDQKRSDNATIVLDVFFSDYATSYVQIGQHFFPTKCGIFSQINVEFDPISEVVSIQKNGS